YGQVESFEDLTPSIELYNTLIGLGHYNSAFAVYQDRISIALLYRLSANRQLTELLEMLFPDGQDQLPRLSSLSDQASTLNELGVGYHFSGQPGRALLLYRRSNTIDEQEFHQENLSVGLRNLSDALQQIGVLREAQLVALQSLVIGRERGDVWAEV